jgi:hypothetical protein
MIRKEKEQRVCNLKWGCGQQLEELGGDRLKTNWMSGSRAGRQLKGMKLTAGWLPVRGGGEALSSSCQIKIKNEIKQK